jgi:hypothetical protein
MATVRTAEEIAAFKAANRAAAPSQHVIKATKKSTPPSFRQELTEMIAEVDDMIRAAKRQGHFHVMETLLSRSAALRKMAAAR